ncbi:MAG: hypothetical protein BCS36_01595 [Desulfovibrio sp. MES5]|uniref:hypothetical protein n=1 Tax=Desulfovibrio sp. MES5 TaxID=1899016 RepID=UPI000B9D3098|nr:hypothetical protein [Desulfovibrio sp. MES5]OXS28048.1 MAG: hypothetical protein BCS36_01595 [Desulfovibrio sp. MES5]
MRIYILIVQGTLAAAFNRADKLRLRLCSKRLLPQPSEQFKKYIALDQRLFAALHAKAFILPEMSFTADFAPRCGARRLRAVLERTPYCKGKML